MNHGFVESNETKEEFIELFKNSVLHMPVFLGDEFFENEAKPGEIQYARENWGFSINYITYDGNKKALPLFTSTELMKSTTLKALQLHCQLIN